MIDWAERLRESTLREDDSLIFRAAVQARAAIERSRTAWGERGVPWEMRGDGVAPEAEWVWLGDAITETCTARRDLELDPELLTFRIREESPMDAATRLDRFRVAVGINGNEPPRWLTTSGAPYLAAPAEALLTHAFRGWQAELQERWEAEADRKARAHYERKGAWPRKLGRRLVTALNESRLVLYVRLVRTAYAAEAEFAGRAAALPPHHRFAVYFAVAEQRGHLVTPEALGPFKEHDATRARALELARRLHGASDPDGPRDRIDRGLETGIDSGAGASSDRGADGPDETGR